MEKLLKRTKHNIFIVAVIIFSSLSTVVNGQIRLGLGTRGNNEDKDKIELNYANPKEYEIAEIKVTGLKTLNENALISISGLKVGDRIKIPGSRTASALKKLWENGIIGNVELFINKVEGNKAYLTLSLTERPRLTRIEYRGIGKTHQTEIDKNLELIRGRVLSDAVVKNAQLTVENYFIDKGFLNVEVDVIKKPDTLMANGTRLILEIDKNKKVRINEINFIGNEDFFETRLQSKMKKTNEKLRFKIFTAAFQFLTSLTPKKLFNYVTKSHEVGKEETRDFFSRHVNVNFFKTSKFKAEDYKADKQNIINFYNSKGYRDARILSDSIYSISDKEINIDIRINEGNKYYFRDIIWTGNFIYTDKQLDQVLGVEKGDVYNMELIQKKITFNPNGTDLGALYMDYGYLFFQVDPVEVQVDGDSIDVEMRIHEGEQATINKVIVKGNDRTNDHVIIRELRTLPGEKFSRSELVRTQRELSQLGYFDPEQIGIQPIPNPADGTVDIEYTLVERPSDNIELSGGWGGYFGFVGTVGLSFNNFSVRNIPHFDKWRPLPIGDGQRLSLRVQANGKQFQNYSLTFTEPWLGGKKPNSFTFGVNRSVQRTGIYNRLYGLADDGGSLKLTSVSVGLGKRLRWPDDYFTINNSVSFTLYEFDNFNYSSSSSQLGIETGAARNFQYNITIARNSIDQLMFPRSGSSISLGVSLTPPYSLFNNIDYDNASRAEKFEWVEYHKWMFDASFFQKLMGNLVFNARAHLGFIDTYSKKAPTGPFDRFQLGGDGLAGNSFILGYDIIGLRGYENNAITPPNYNQSSASDELVGGVAYNKYVLELRYPVTLSPQSTIFVLAFAEGGNNFHKTKDFDPFKLYRSAGVGARIFMPAFGLMGIDWGYGFDRLPGSLERSGPQFHFTIGHQFR